MAHEISETWQVSGHDDELDGSETLSEVAEAYVLAHLTPERHEEYEVHLLACSVCRQEVELVTEFIETLRLAVQGIDPLPLWAALASKN
jgi:anti-sigma factor RsiW